MATNYKLMQYHKMIQDGIDSADAARAIGMELEGVQLAALSASKQEVSIEELLEIGKKESVEVLLCILRGQVPDTRPCDLISVGKIFIENHGRLPEVASNAMAERLARMKQAKESIMKTRDVDSTPVIELQAA